MQTCEALRPTLGNEPADLLVVPENKDDMNFATQIQGLYYLTTIWLGCYSVLL